MFARVSLTSTLEDDRGCIIGIKCMLYIDCCQGKPGFISDPLIRAEAEQIEFIYRD